jgi:putative flippase GtrA
MRLLESTLVRYILVAISAYIVDIGVFSILYQGDLASIAASNITGKISTAIFGFFAHRRVTFGLTGHRNIGKEAIKYFTIAALYAPFTTGLLLLLGPISPNTTIAKIIADTIGVGATFIVSKLFIFTKPGQRLDSPP